MMNSNNFVRGDNSALLNGDAAAYEASRIRRRKEKEFSDLLLKVEKLETCVENLKLRIEEIENNGNS